LPSAAIFGGFESAAANNAAPIRYNQSFFMVKLLWIEVASLPALTICRNGHRHF
jgi:hypothetical protein